ncbi:MAG TPA: helix-turn-helix domain-containing protein [Capillimicrobium sp.]|nr:helix-turn-helix domain-containing protein [Capillimicrobium sp.]
MRNADRRDAILAAALEVFAQRGYGGASMSEIRVAAGASTGSLYHHFPTKEHIAAALVLDALADFHGAFLAVLDRAGDDARAAIEGGVRAYLEWSEAHRREARLLVVEMDAAVAAAAGDRLRDANRSFFAAVDRWTRARIEAGQLRELPPPVLHALWMGPASQLARNRLTGRPSEPVDGLAGALAAGAWRALAP